jgi:hypothetical protein
MGQTALKYGHGGADYITLHEFVNAVRNKVQTPIDVYDSATWSVSVPLSKKSGGVQESGGRLPRFHAREVEKRQGLRFVGRE